MLVTWVCTHAAVEGQHVVQPMESGIPAPPRLVMWTIETVYAIAHHNLTADARPSAEGARRGACLRAQAGGCSSLGSPAGRQSCVGMQRGEDLAAAASSRQHLHLVAVFHRDEGCGNHPRRITQDEVALGWPSMRTP